VLFYERAHTQTKILELWRKREVHALPPTL